MVLRLDAPPVMPPNLLPLELENKKSVKTATFLRLRIVASSLITD